MSQLFALCLVLDAAEYHLTRCVATRDNSMLRWRARWHAGWIEADLKPFLRLAPGTVLLKCYIRVCWALWWWDAGGLFAVFVSRLSPTGVRFGTRTAGRIHRGYS